MKLYEITITSMKIGKYNITLKNIKAYIQGNYRLLSERFGKLDTHIKEQVIYRDTVADLECKRIGECKCGCPLPDLYYADKTCEDSCYPELMDKDTWEKFKTDNNILITTDSYDNNNT